MRHHRTVGPPSKPGHGRGSAPYEPSDSTSRPWGGASWTVEKQRASCKWHSLKHGVTLSETWRDTLWNMAWRSLGSWLSGTSLFNIAGAALVTSLPARALTWTLSRHRLNQPSIRRRRLEGTTSKNNELNAYGWKDSFLWRHAAATSLVFSTRGHPETHEPTHVVPEHKDQSNAFEGNKQLPTCFLSTSKYILTKSILLIELVESDLNAVTEQ